MVMETEGFFGWGKKTVRNTSLGLESHSVTLSILSTLSQTKKSENGSLRGGETMRSDLATVNLRYIFKI